jgi:hypothetical protein
MYNADSSVTLTNCTFTDNHASAYRYPLAYGGGMYNSGSSLTLTDCTFRSNRTSFGDGGGMNNSGSSLTLTDCVFEGNKSDELAGVPGGGGGCTI